jgi:hypothetical protein
MAATAIHMRFLTRRVSLDTCLIVLVPTCVFRSMWAIVPFDVGTDYGKTQNAAHIATESLLARKQVGRW